jgi:amino acid adenylation domain-containing protein
MTTIELLARLRRLNITLWAEGDRLRFQGPKGALTDELRKALAEHKAEVLALLQEASTATQELPAPIQRAPRGDKVPLSFAQQRLWFLDQLEPGSPLYNIPSAVRLTGQLDIRTLQRSFDAIAERHAALRTTFATVDQQPMQVIAPPTPLDMPCVDLRGLPAGEREAAAREFANAEAQMPFDLARGPLLRVKLLQLGDAEYIVLLTMHHIISDGWSIGIVIRELALLYMAFAKDLPSPLPELPIQYVDFAVRQRQWLQDQVLELQLSYWKQQLQGAPATLELPTDRPRSPTQTFRGATMPFRVPLALSQALHALSQREGATLFMALLAAFQTLLFRYSGQTDILIGSPIANRTRKEIEDLIGVFVNTLVLRADLSGNPKFVDLLGQVSRTALGAFAHQDLPFERLVEAIQPARDLSRSPLFQVMLVLQNVPFEALELPNLTLQPIALDSGTAKFDLSLSMAEQADGLAGTIAYNTDLFDHTTIARMLDHFHMLLAGIAADPDQTIGRLPLLTNAEQQQLLIDWNRSDVDYPPAAAVHQLIEAQAARTPNATAIVFEDQSLTYAELNARANQLAHYLRQRGVGQEMVVGVCVERSLEIIIACLGVLKAGGAYVPLESRQITARLAAIMEEAGAIYLITQEHLLASFPPHASEILCLEQIADEVAQQPGENISGTPLASSLVYLLFTSGSTGRPKGVAVEHQHLLNYVLAVQERLELPSDASYATVSSFAADLGNTMIFPALCFGGCLHVITYDRATNPDLYAEYCQRHRIDCLKIVPSHLIALLNTRHAADVLPRQRLVLGGETSTWELIERIYGLVPACRIFNHYGPTETTVGATTYPLERGIRQATATVPIGTPLGTMQIYLLDTHYQPVPVGVPGEIYIGGGQVARGYLNHPAPTAETFVPDPFSRLQGTQPGARLYRTGDLARYLPDGTIEFLGRRDHQIKIRGFRIELGEIEMALREHPVLRDAVVVAREDTPPAGGHSDKRLVAYVVAHTTPEPTVSELRRYLQAHLPDYMVPSAFVSLPALPLTPNGKIDRRALPTPDGARPELEHTFVAPRTPTEALLVELWNDVLGTERVGVHDNFFDLGGHSLLATQLVSRVRNALLVDLPLRDVFAAPTVAAMTEVIKTIRAGDHTQDDAPPLRPIEHAGPLPLSFSQERMWFLNQLDPGSPHYNMPSVLRVSGRLDTAAFERSLNTIIRRHEILRTTFTIAEGHPLQVIAPPTPLDMPCVDLRGLPAGEREAAAREFANAEAQTPFDLARGPLLRVKLLQLGDAEYIVLFTTHHIISDGWSTSVIVGELGQLYSAFARSEEPSLPELPIQYADFAMWQREWLQGEVLERQLHYWKHQLGNESSRGAVPLLDLPTDQPRPSVQSYGGKAIKFTLPQPLADGIAAICQREQVTPFMILLSAFQVLLFRYSDQDDIAIGVPIANRNRREIEPLIGCFINTLVLRADLSGAPSFRELLGRVRQSTLGAYDHQDLPFEVLVDTLQPTRQLSYNPLFQVMFVMQNTPMQEFNLPDTRLSMVTLETETAKTDLTLEIVPIGETLVGSFAYNTDLFDHTTITRMVTHFVTLLEGIVADLSTRITHVPLLTKAEQQQMLQDWNQSVAEYPRAAAVHQLIEAQAARMPNVTAIVFEGAALTYAELNTRANQLAHYLRAQGVGPDVLIALCVERSLEMIVGMLAILKAGGAYVPLDPAYPAERVQYMLAHSCAPVIVTQARLVDRLPDHQAQVFRLDADWPTLAAQPTTNPPRVVLPEHLAYIIYTSGSTGRPKGVMVTQQGLINLVHGLRTYFDDRQVTITGLITSISFDISVNQIFPTLIFGRTLHIIPDAVKFDSRALIRYLDTHQIHLLDAVPSYIQAVLNEVAPEQPDNALRYFLIGGEKIEQRLLQSVFAQLGSAVEIVNIYGLTEISDINILGSIRAEDIGKPITAGKPLQNNRIYILDQHNQPQPIGIAGEVCVSGESVSRGYLFRPELTAERFVACPFEDGQLMVRTGDLGRWRADGTVEILGRIDHQVKIRGFRIETGEIEAVLATDPNVNECVVVVREDMAGDKRLVAYVAPREGLAAPPTGELRQLLSAHLPDYMLPSAFVMLPALPKTPSGKIDRGALPALGELASGTPDTFVAPRDTLELRLARIWEALLGVRTVGIRDNFFELGGHSLLVVRLMAQIQAQIGQKIPLATLFQEPTVEHLARTLRQFSATPLDTPLIALQPGRGKLPFFCVHPAAGSVLSYLELARLLGSDQPFYGFQAAGLEGEQTPHTQVEDMAAVYLAALQSAQPEGPYLLGGWSFGGLVAYEMARQLTAQGHEVGLLALFDSRAPTPEAAPSVDQTTLLTWFANDLGRTFGADLVVSAETLVALEPKQRLQYVLDQARSTGLLPPDIGEREISTYLNVFTASLRAMQAYQPHPYAGRVMLFRAGDRPLDAAGETLGWEALAADGVSLRVIPGDHYTIVRQPHVATLANQLRACLDEAQTLREAQAADG